MRIFYAIIGFIIISEIITSCDDSNVRPAINCRLETETTSLYRWTSDDTVTHVINYEYDSIGRVSKSGSTTFTYYSDSLVVSNNSGIRVEYKFENGRIVSVIGGGTQQRFEYDDQGNLVKRISPNYRGKMTDYFITMKNGNITEMEWMDNDVTTTFQELHFDNGKNPKKGLISELHNNDWRSYFNTNNWTLKWF